MHTNTQHDTTLTETADSPRLGARENWWGGGDDTPEQPAAGTDRGGHAELLGVNKEAWVAETILRGWPTATFCAQNASGKDTYTPLSSPDIYVPRSRVVEEADRNRCADVGTFIRELYADHRQHRTCLTCNLVS